MEVKTVIEAIIIIVVVGFLIFLPSKGYTAVKYILNYGEEGVVKDTPEGVSGEFQNIISDFEAYANSNDNNCLVDIKLLRFPSDYSLTFISPNIIEITNPTRKMIVKDNRQFLKKGIVNCYLYDNGLKIKNVDGASYLPLDLIPFRIIKKSQGDSMLLSAKYDRPNSQDELISFLFKNNLKDMFDYFFLEDKYLFYKQDNNICFILESTLTKEGQEYIKTLNKCSPKPLNSKL